MISSHCLVLIFQIGQLEGGQREAAEVLRAGAGIFALILFTLSLYAWSRRRQPALLIVSLAFLLFFITHVVQIAADVYEFNASMNLVLVLMDFIILALFFVAIVVRPRRKEQES
jgi:heme A synthase